MEGMHETSPGTGLTSSSAVQTIGQSLDNRDIQLVIVGTPGTGRNIWVTTGDATLESILIAPSSAAHWLLG